MDSATVEYILQFYDKLLISNFHGQKVDNNDFYVDHHIVMLVF